MAAPKAGIKTVKAWIHKGGEREAYLFSLTANDSHGNPTSPEDKRKQVETLLLDPEWSKWSNNVIGKMCKRSGTYVAAVAKEMGLNRNAPRKAIRNGKEYDVDASNIGEHAKKRGKNPQKVAPAEEVKGDPLAHSQESTTPESDADNDGILDAAMKQVLPPATSVSGEEHVGMAPTAVAANSAPTAQATDSASSNSVDVSNTDEVKSANVILGKEVEHLFDSEGEMDEDHELLVFCFNPRLVGLKKKAIRALYKKLGGIVMASKAICPDLELDFTDLLPKERDESEKYLKQK